MRTNLIPRLPGCWLVALLAIAGCGSPSGYSPVSRASPTPAVFAKDAHARLVPLQGGQNFRDMGGYQTTDGKSVRWGMLFRSGSMHNLSPADLKYLEEDLGLRTVVDLRSTAERTDEPVNWPAAKPPTVLSADYKMDNSAIMNAFIKPNVTADELRTAMISTYQELPFRLAGQYRRMFDQLKSGAAPLAVNCTAGKDRTGVASALLLTALGVPRETVIDDFLLSNEYYRPVQLKSGAGNQSSLGGVAALPPDVSRLLLGVERQYLEATFSIIEQRPGGMDAYFSEQLGLSKADIAKLRKRYLQ